MAVKLKRESRVNFICVRLSALIDSSNKSCLGSHSHVHRAVGRFL